MDQDRKYTEGVPLNSENLPNGNVYVNSRKATKINASNGAVIHCKIDRVNPKDVGLHINTTLAVTSTKKLKLLFSLVFILCIVSLVVSCILAVYFCNQMISIKSQLDIVKSQIIHKNDLDNDDIQSSLLVMGRNNNNPKRIAVKYDDEEYKLRERSSAEARSLPRYIENYPRAEASILNLPERKVLDRSDREKPDAHNDGEKNDIIIAHYIGAYTEIQLKNADMRVGPWVLDRNISRNSANKLELSKLDSKTILVKESGVYFIYVQVKDSTWAPSHLMLSVNAAINIYSEPLIPAGLKMLVYLSSSPNAYNVFARADPATPRLLASCATLGGVPHPLTRSKRPPQVSCGVQSVVRLYAGDELEIAQREENVTVSLRQGYTYFGLHKLH